MGSSRLTPEFLIRNLRKPFPPLLLPCVPTTALIHAPRHDPSDGLAHGFGGLPRPFLKIDTGGVDDLIPEVNSDLKVFLAQFHPSIKCLSYEKGHRHASNLLLISHRLSSFPILPPSSLGHVTTARMSASQTIATLK